MRSTQALLKHFLHSRQWKTALLRAHFQLNKTSQTNHYLRPFTFAPHLRGCTLFSVLLLKKQNFQVADLQLLQTLQNEGELFKPPHPPYINIHYCFPFYFKLIPHASWLINFVNKKEMILRYPNVLQIITVDSSYV